MPRRWRRWPRRRGRELRTAGDSDDDAARRRRRRRTTGEGGRGDGSRERGGRCWSEDSTDSPSGGVSNLFTYPTQHTTTTIKPILSNTPASAFRPAQKHLSALLFIKHASCLQYTVAPMSVLFLLCMSICLLPALSAFVPLTQILLQTPLGTPT